MYVATAAATLPSQLLSSCHVCASPSCANVSPAYCCYVRVCVCQLLVSVLRSLGSASYVVNEMSDVEHLILTAEGETYRAHGTPEGQLYHALPADGTTTLANVNMDKAIVQLGLNQAMAKK